VTHLDQGHGAEHAYVTGTPVVEQGHGAAHGYVTAGKTASGDWTPPRLSEDHAKALDHPDYIERKHKLLNLAKNPTPGVKMWRGEVRHKDHLADPPSVGMHWSINPDQVISPNEVPEDHHRVIWEATLHDPKKESIPRNHPIWSGKHMSMDSEAEIRLRPHENDVHVTRRYVHDNVANNSATPVVQYPERSMPGWTAHDMDHHVPVQHARSQGDGLMGYHKAYPDLFATKPKSEQPEGEPLYYGSTHPRSKKLVAPNHFDGETHVRTSTDWNEAYGHAQDKVLDSYGPDKGPDDHLDPDDIRVYRVTHRDRTGAPPIHASPTERHHPMVHIEHDANDGPTHHLGRRVMSSIPGHQRELLSTPDSDKDKRGRLLDLARNPTPGTHIWRGEVRHKDDLAAPGEVGMHWSVNPMSMVLHSNRGLHPDHRRVMWQATVDEPGKQSIPRSHKIWSGRDESFDSEAEVRLHPQAKVHINGAYVFHGDEDRPAHGSATVSPDPTRPHEMAPGWKFHPMDHRADVTPGPIKERYKTDYPDLFGKAPAPAQDRAARPQECNWGNHPATHSLRYQEGRYGYMPSCDEHAEKSRAAIKGMGEEVQTVHHLGRRAEPDQRLFGKTFGLDHRLFDGEHLKPDVRTYILETLGEFWKGQHGVNWDEWARVYFAGSEASEWTSESLEGNGDFDVLIGVDYDAFRANACKCHPAGTDEEITAQLNEGLRHLDEKTSHAMILIDGKLEGPFDNTWYVNQDSWDIRAIRPYAAYNVTDDVWAVKPPHLESWDISQFPEGHALVQEAHAVASYVRAVLALPEPYRSQQGVALWEHLHGDRSRAFGPQGEGWFDPGNVLEKYLDQLGLWEKLVKVRMNAREHPEVLNSPTNWSNDPR
jgi:hypothetical protein